MDTAVFTQLLPYHRDRPGLGQNFHREVGELLLVKTIIAHGDDARMAQRRQCLKFMGQAQAQIVRSGLPGGAVQSFEGYFLLREAIHGAPDGPHATRAKRRQQLVAVANSRLNQGCWGWRRHFSSSLPKVYVVWLWGVFISAKCGGAVQAWGNGRHPAAAANCAQTLFTLSARLRCCTTVTCSADNARHKRSIPSCASRLCSATAAAD